jgi:succinoglycan biosynthesis protein ExoW
MENVNMSQLISVVIPYYQKERGLLRQCVESVLSQQGGFCIQVIVVDDASPVPASEELNDLLPEDRRITVIVQDNAGPGAARNNGLEHIPADTRYVAFIDSDDCWQEDFLLHAMDCMQMGYDIFFANSRRVGFADTRFEWSSEEGLDLVATDHRFLCGGRPLYAFNGDFFSYAIKRSNIISTSALVYRLGVAPDLRFSTRLYNGQDRLFKLALSQKTNKVAFAAQVLVAEGAGVNIFDSASWGSKKSLVLLVNYIKLSKCILEELTLSDNNKNYVKKQLDDTRYSMVASILHLVLKRKEVNWKLVAVFIKNDPLSIFMLFPNLVRVFINKVHSAF